MSDYTRPRAAAIEASLTAGLILRSRFGGPVEISTKGTPLDLVTEADLESEDTILSTLRARFPHVAVLAEERGESPGSPGSPDRRFIVDPLDGTTNFAHGYPLFAVSIAYEEDGKVRVGVVYDPLHEELFVAEEGDGAYLNGRPLRVSETGSLEKALLVTGFPYDLKVDVRSALRLFERFMAEARAIRRDGSAALDLCYVAAGRFDGFWEEKLSPWDTAAGSLLVSEAGGRVTDIAGGPFSCFGASVLATNRRLHQEMLRVLAEVES